MLELSQRHPSVLALKASQLFHRSLTSCCPYFSLSLTHSHTHDAVMNDRKSGSVLGLLLRLTSKCTFPKPPSFHFLPSLLSALKSQNLEIQVNHTPILKHVYLYIYLICPESKLVLWNIVKRVCFEMVKPVYCN
jgi:hypothetical protein